MLKWIEKRWLERRVELRRTKNPSQEMEYSRGEEWRCSSERMNRGLFSFHPQSPTSPLYTAGRLRVCPLPALILEHTLSHMPIFYFAVHIPVYMLCSGCMRAAKRKLQELSHQLRKLMGNTGQWESGWAVAMAVARWEFLAFHSNFPSIVELTGCEWAAMLAWLR